MPGSFHILNTGKKNKTKQAVSSSHAFLKTVAVRLGNPKYQAQKVTKLQITFLFFLLIDCFLQSYTSTVSCNL